MALMMHWQRGFKRIRLVGSIALLLGVVLLGSVLLTQLLGYAPNPGFVGLYSAFWPLGLMLLVLGLLLWVAVWVLSGFLPDGTEATTAVGVSGSAPAPKARFYS
jgi:uncharacterized BrkB/YihY/UPF0761 family membrane protein